MFSNKYDLDLKRQADYLRIRIDKLKFKIRD